MTEALPVFVVVAVLVVAVGAGAVAVAIAIDATIDATVAMLARKPHGALGSARLACL